ncbi:MAG: hypothetical protein WDO73_00980 [Ignavibacteriota bacterium]
MLKKINGNIAIALCTAGAMIAYEFYERYGASIQVPAVAFYGAAAGICLLPTMYALLGRKACTGR